MPEEQSFWGDEWNDRLDRFLTQVLGWKQLGQSKTDIYCERLKRKVGIDSVFAYKRNANANQQVVFVEAKSAEKMGNVNRSKIQVWVDRFIEKLENAPHSPDFTEKFNPEENAQFGMGLLGLWIRDHETFSPEQMRDWLAQLRTPQRRNPLNVCFISNQTISRFCAIHEEVDRLRRVAGYREVRLHFPDYGTVPSADGLCVPIETLLSKFVFGRATKAQDVKGRRELIEYQSSIVFYLGEVVDFADLRFIGLAVRYFQLDETKDGQSGDVEVYTLHDPASLRNQIENFDSEFGKPNNVTFRFKKLNVGGELPGWIEQDD